jgi:hypothetical protein
MKWGVRRGPPYPLGGKKEKAGKAGTANRDGAPKDGIIKRQLEEAGIKGDIHIPPRSIDAGSLGFDDYHINTEQKHGVTEKEAKSFVKNAIVSATKWDGQFENYYGHAGVAYVNIAEHVIRTAYKPNEYKGDVERIMEVLKKNDR